MFILSCRMAKRKRSSLKRDSRGRFLKETMKKKRRRRQRRRKKSKKTSRRRRRSRKKALFEFIKCKKNKKH